MNNMLSEKKEEKRILQI